MENADRCPACGSAIGCLGCNPAAVRDSILLRKANARVLELEGALKKAGELAKKCADRFESIEAGARGVSEGLAGVHHEILPAAEKFATTFGLLDKLRHFLQDHFGLGHSKV